MTTAQSAQPTTTVEHTKPAVIRNADSVKIDFGNGRYSPLMCECLDSLMTCFGVSLDEAEVIAKKIASDYGAYMSSKGIGLASVKVGKANKDGKVTLKEAALSVKGVTLTWGLAVLKCLKYVSESSESGINYGFTKWKFTEAMQKNVDAMLKK